MTTHIPPKEKAREMIDSFRDALTLKDCAMVEVNEIIDAIDWHEHDTPTKELNYWLDVRKEIKNK
jgi:hypothetical protein